jgi:hypothetical protein
MSDRHWVIRRMVHDRAKVLVTHHRAQAVLELSAPKLVRVSWSAWLRAEHADADPLAPTPELEAMIRTVEILARGQHPPSLPYCPGIPRADLDPRVLAIDELAEAVGLSRDDVDARTSEIGRAFARTADAALARWREDMEADRRPEKSAPPTHAEPEPDRAPAPRRSFRSVVAPRASLPGWARALIFADEPPPIPEDNSGADGHGPGLDEEFEAVDDAEAIALEFEDERRLVIVRKALSGVARVAGRYTLDVVADLLVGRATGCIRHEGLDAVSTFGVLAKHDCAWVRGLLTACECAGLVERRGLTVLGSEVMLGRDSVRVEFDGWE